MAINEEQIRRIFGLKLKQIREKHDLSLFGLSKKTGLSKSYLNEIEKGKKYPKPDKIVAIASALNTSYDEMVSMKLTGKMAPLSEMIMSGVLKEIPLEIFGIEEGNLIDIIANAPEKVTAFIGTLFEIAQSFDISKEYFYLSALRSYQESHLNYSDEIEKSVTSFCNRYQIDQNKKLESKDLNELLVEEFGYSITYKKLNPDELNGQIRSVFVPKRQELIIDQDMSESQKVFILAKELGYCHMDITIRPLTFSWIKFTAFEEVMNNYKASYFAGALIINKEKMVEGLKKIMTAKTWNPENVFKLIFSFTDSAETFFQRMTNLLPTFFGIHDMFFIRLSTSDDEGVVMNKELHMGKSYHPRGNNSLENYCRRWVCADILLNEENYPENQKIRLGIQRSEFEGTQAKHLVLTASSEDPFNRDSKRSVCIGMALNTKQQKRIGFFNSKTIKERLVGNTCERCPIEDCQERASAPSILKMEHRKDQIESRIDQLIKDLE